MPGRNKVSTMGRKTRKDRKKILKQQKLLCEMEGTYTETCIEVCCHHGPGASSSGKGCGGGGQHQDCQVCLSLLREIAIREGRDHLVQLEEIASHPCVCDHHHGHHEKSVKTTSTEEKVALSTSQAPTKLTNGCADEEKDVNPSEPEEAPNSKSIQSVLDDDQIRTELTTLPTFKQEVKRLSIMREGIVRPFVNWLHALDKIVHKLMLDLIEAGNGMGDDKITILKDMRVLAIAAGRKSNKLSAKEIGQSLSRVDFLREDLKKQLDSFKGACDRYSDLIESAIKVVERFNTDWRVHMGNLKRQDAALKAFVASIWKQTNTPLAIEEEIDNFTLLKEHKFVLEKQVLALKEFSEFIGAHKGEAKLCHNFYASIRFMLGAKEEFSGAAGPAMEKKFFDMEQKFRKSNRIMKTDTNKIFKVNLGRLDEVLDLVKVLYSNLDSEPDFIKKIVNEALEAKVEKKMHTAGGGEDDGGGNKASVQNGDGCPEVRSDSPDLNIDFDAINISEEVSNLASE